MSTEPITADKVEVEPANVGTLTEVERIRRLHEFPTGETAADAVMVPIELLKLATRNPRRGAVAEVIESLREFGQHRPVVVQRSTGEVVVGNHMLKAARSLGWASMAALIVNDDDDKAMRRALADNFTGDKAKWDEEELALVLKDVGVVPGTSQSEVDKLLASLEPPEKKDDPTYPLVPRLNEKYDYVVVFAENETDATWLQTRFGLRKEKSYKSNAVAVSHVITIARLRELLGEDA
jgi:hypothetical protein